MRTRHTFLFASLVAALTITGCSKKETIPSDEVTTAGMSLDFKVTSNGTTSSAIIAIHVGDYDSNVFVRLVAQDSLKLTTPDGTTPTLNQLVNTFGGSERTVYVAENMKATEGTFTLDFFHAGSNAKGNTLTLPSSFTLTGPTGVVSRRSPVTLNWTNPGTGYQVTIDAKGDCIFDTTKTVIGEPGSFTFNAGDLSSLSGREKDTCPVTFTVHRDGKTSNGFSSEFHHPSRAEAIQERSVVVQTGE
jgi:hypothetical protein